METAYIGIGSNIGGRARYLDAAVNAMRDLGEIIALSQVYDTEPCDVPSPQNRYLNMVIGLDTALSPIELLNGMLTIERNHGRIRTVRNAPRTLDLDILFYGSLKIDSPRLTVPHRRAHERAFVLAPMSEIAPKLWHPTLNGTISELCANVSTSGIVRLGTLAQLKQRDQIALPA